jgi:hypothetical protein
LWTSHDPVATSTDNATAVTPDITWGRISTPFDIGTIANGITWPAGTAWPQFNAGGFGAGLSGAGSGSSPSGVLWTAADPIAPIGGAPGPLAGRQACAIAQPSEPVGLGVADNRLMAGVLSNPTQYLAFRMG